MNVLNTQLRIEYNIQCKFKKILTKSALSLKAVKLKCTCLVDLFHEHVYSRWCQLYYFGTYVSEQGIEDFEECKRNFTKLNALALIVYH